MSARRFLHEISAARDLEDVCEANLSAVDTLDNDQKDQAIVMKASDLSDQASMYESVGKVKRAIELDTEGYEMRLQERPLKDGLFEQNLAYGYKTANNHVNALKWFEKSRDTWIAWNEKNGREVHWPAVTKTNTARCYVYLEQYDKAI